MSPTCLNLHPVYLLRTKKHHTNVRIKCSRLAGHEGQCSVVYYNSEENCMTTLFWGIPTITSVLVEYEEEGE